MRLPLYFISTVVLFWLPSLVLGAAILKRLDPLTRKAFWLTLAIFWPVSLGMEYAYLWAKVYTFSEAKDPLLGIWLFGAPIEEFSYWWGAILLILLLYLGFDIFFKRKATHA